MADKKSWMDALSETVDKATKAATEAWDGTADVRKDAWVKTKEAVNTASDALDQGVEKAMAAYKEGAGDEPDADTPVEVDAQVEEGVDIDEPAPVTDEPDASDGTVEINDSDEASPAEPGDDTDESEAS